jgi:hypothetical protein
MLQSASPAAPAAVTLPLFLPQAPPDKVSGLIHAATLLAQQFGQGRALDSRALRSAMETAFAASDTAGGWVWKAPKQRPSSRPTSCSNRPPAPACPVRLAKAVLPQFALVKRLLPAPDCIELAYETCDWTPAAGARLTASLYEGYALQAIRIPDTPAASDYPVLPASSRTRSSGASSMPAKRMPVISPVPTRSTRPTTPCRPLRKTPKEPCASAAAGFSATAPAPARAARSPRSFSTTGSKDAAARPRFPNPTN